MMGKGRGGASSGVAAGQVTAAALTPPGRRRHPPHLRGFSSSFFGIVVHLNITTYKACSPVSNSEPSSLSRNPRGSRKFWRGKPALGGVGRRSRELPPCAWTAPRGPGHGAERNSRWRMNSITQPWQRLRIQSWRTML